jgi:hypothetical protein
VALDVVPIEDGTHRDVAVQLVAGAAPGREGGWVGGVFVADHQKVVTGGAELADAD